MEFNRLLSLAINFYGESTESEKKGKEKTIKNYKSRHKQL